MANYGCTIERAGTLPSVRTSGGYTLTRRVSIFSGFNGQSRGIAYCGDGPRSSYSQYERYEIAGPGGINSTVTGITAPASDQFTVAAGLWTYSGRSRWPQGASDGVVTIPEGRFLPMTGVYMGTSWYALCACDTGTVYVARYATISHEGGASTNGIVLYDVSDFDPERDYVPKLYDFGVSGQPIFPSTTTSMALIMNNGNPIFLYANSGSTTTIAKWENGSTTRHWIRFPIQVAGTFITGATIINVDYNYIYFQYYVSGSNTYYIRMPISAVYTAPSGNYLDIDNCDIGQWPLSGNSFRMPYNGGLYIGERSPNNPTSTSTIQVWYLRFATMPPEPPEPSDDPYQEEGGISDYGGGGAGIDMTESDDIDFPTPPSNLIADCGLISFYNPSKQEIIDLADQIMSQSIAGAIKNIFTDPLEGIVSLALFNGSPPLSGSRGEIKVGLIGTGVTANLLSSSYMTLDCGSITVGDKTKGNALDFSPYTTAQLYLPYIGFATVSPDDFMYGTVHIKYNIDLLSGSCVAMVRIQKDGKNDLLYTYSGNVLTSIPLSGKNYKEIIKATATITAAVAVGGAAGGITTGAATGALSSAAKAGFVEYMDQFESAGVSAATKPSITRSGRLDMSIGAMSPKKPYLVFSRPAQSLPEKFKSYRGYPSNVTTKLSELVGYTEVQDVHLTGIPATTEELDLIMENLKGGIII